MAAPTPLTAGRLVAGDFLGAVKPDDLVYFCCNVGDGDAQVILLPQTEHAPRRAIIVDSGTVSGKVPALLEALSEAGLLPLDGDEGDAIPLVVATHPHNDHISGIPKLLRDFGHHVAEFWEPGFFHTGPAYHGTMQELQKLGHVAFTQPTSGLQRFFERVCITVLAPAVQLRNRFDTYGVEINDSSISLRIEYPAGLVTAPQTQANYQPGAKSATLILGADAQTLSWSYVATDFPYLMRSASPVAKAIGGGTTSRDLLSADVLKVAHHASKHGVNLELIERIAPSFTLVSSVGGGGSYRFPHTVTQEALREAIQPIAGGTNARKSDEELRIFYTSDTSAPDGAPAGSFAALLNGRRRQLWRFGDEPTDPIDLTHARSVS